MCNSVKSKMPYKIKMSCNYILIEFVMYIYVNIQENKLVNFQSFFFCK